MTNICIEHEVALALTGRIAGIKQADGYQTDIGAKVFRGKLRLSENDVPCAVIVEKDDAPAQQQGVKVKNRCPFLIEGHAACDPDHPNDTGHKIVSDIKKAIWGDKSALHPAVKDIRYVGRSLSPREDGFAQVSAVVEVEIELVCSLD